MMLRSLILGFAIVVMVLAPTLSYAAACCCMNSSDTQIENAEGQTMPCHNMADESAGNHTSPETVSDVYNLCMCDAGLNTSFNAAFYDTSANLIFYEVVFTDSYDASFPSLRLTERFRPPIDFS